MPPLIPPEDNQPPDDQMPPDYPTVEPEDEPPPPPIPPLIPELDPYPQISWPRTEPVPPVVIPTEIGKDSDPSIPFANLQYVQIADDNGNPLSTIPLPVPCVVPYFTGTGYLTQFKDMKEYLGSGEVSFDESGWKGTRIFEVPWSDWQEFSAGLLGYPVVNSSGGLPIYFLPDVFSAGMPWLWCRRISMKPKGDLIRGLDDDPLTPRVRYERAEITATYLPLDIGSRFSPGGEILTIPGTGFAWLGTDIRNSLNEIYGGSTIPPTVTLGNNNINKLVPGSEFCIRKYMIPTAMMPTLTLWQGCVNLVPFLDWDSFQLLLMAIEGQRQWTANGTPVCEVDFKFQIKPNSWLSLYNPNPGGTTPASGGLTTPGYQFVAAVSAAGQQFQLAPGGLGWQQLNANSGPSNQTPLNDFGGYTINTPNNQYGLPIPQELGYPYAVIDFNALLQLF